MWITYFNSFKVKCDAYDAHKFQLKKSTSKEYSIIILTDSLSLVSRLQARKVNNSLNNSLIKSRQIILAIFSSILNTLIGFNRYWH